ARARAGRHRYARSAAASASALPCHGLGTRTGRTIGSRTLHSFMVGPTRLACLGVAVPTGLTINVVYDASVARAPTGFKTTVAAAVAFLESQFSTPLTF